MTVLVRGAAAGVVVFPCGGVVGVVTGVGLSQLIGYAAGWSTIVTTWSIVLAFFPAAVVGLLAHDFIKSVLFNSPQLICVVLIIGGTGCSLVSKLYRLLVQPACSGYFKNQFCSVCTRRRLVAGDKIAI